MMDNASASQAIAIKLDDLHEAESNGEISPEIAEIQRQQLYLDTDFDFELFQSSKRMAISMAKAVEDDGQFIARTSRQPQIDDVMYARLAKLNRLPDPLLCSMERKAVDANR